jgi:hypothetical protein
MDAPTEITDAELQAAAVNLDFFAVRLQGILALGGKMKQLGSLMNAEREIRARLTDLQAQAAAVNAVVAGADAAQRRGTPKPIFSLPTRDLRLPPRQRPKPPAMPARSPSARPGLPSWAPRSRRAKATFTQSTNRSPICAPGSGQSNKRKEQPMPKVEDSKSQESRTNDGRTYDQSVKIEDVGAGAMPDSPPRQAPFVNPDPKSIHDFDC